MAERSKRPPRPPSLVERLLARLGPRGLHDALTPGERLALRYLWRAWARPTTQLETGEFTGQVAPPGEWATWEVLAGRAFGKTRLAAEWVREKRTEFPGCRIALVGATAGETRKVMVRGDSGLLSCSPPWDKPEFNVTDQCLQWADGTTAFLYSAEVPDSLRGPQHNFAWIDEPAKFMESKLLDTFDNLMMGLRLGMHPQMLLTTTPRPLDLLKKLKAQKSTAFTLGATFENSALPKSYIDQMLAQYEGTSLGDQELYAIMLDQVDGALWNMQWIDDGRVDEAPALVRIVVGIDPALTSKRVSDEAGVVVVGLGDDGHAYILEDASLKASPDAWAQRAVRAFNDWRADVMVEETIRGGELVESVIHLVDDKIKVIAKGGNKGKRVRAEPVAALYEQGRVHHVGRFKELEKQMCTFTKDSKKSPNNMDAMVYAVAELMLEGDGPMVLL